LKILKNSYWGLF